MEIQIWSRSETLGRCFAGATTISDFSDERCRFRLRFRLRPRFRSDFIDTTGRYEFRERRGSALMSQQRPMLPVIRTGTKTPVTSLNDDRNKIGKYRKWNGNNRNETKTDFEPSFASKPRQGCFKFWFHDDSVLKELMNFFNRTRNTIENLTNPTWPNHS